MRRYLVPLIFGLGGVAVLMSLGFWQLDRLEQKLDRLARIEAKIGDAPGDLLMEPDAGRDQYLPVSVSGDLLEGAARVLISAGGQGAGYRLISPFRLSDGRLVMIDEGYVGLTADSAPGEARGVTVTGNLDWPDEADRWTPAPDLSQRQFYARDVEALAEVLGTAPILIVARDMSGTDLRATPLPVTVDRIPNNHLGYAVQWFGLAAVWLGMTAFLLWRIRKRTV